MARVWTPEQESAIKTRNRTLLISAAAGSGKTATLTERIIRSVLDEKNPESISNMLIVTFTKAAVGELRERITLAVREALKDRPSDERLERELLMLPAARICTIDSYCAEILRSNADRVGVSPTYRIADEGEAELLCDNILEGLISAVYEGELPEVATPEEFDELADCITDVKDTESTASAIRYVYVKTMNTEGGVDSLLDLVEEYNTDKKKTPEDTAFGKYVIERAHHFAKHYNDALGKIEVEVSAFGDSVAKHMEVISSDIEFLRSVLNSTSYVGIRTLIMGRGFADTPKKLSDPAFPPLTELRAEMRDDAKKLIGDFFSYSEEEWKSCSGQLYRLLSILYRFIKKFDQVFRGEKMRRGVLEYSDVERFTYECLWQNGELTELAYSQAEMYTSVYIDEYQDVNSLQAKIFEAITGQGCGFMVGDVKQSIYGFRNANPTVFVDKKNRYTPLESSLNDTEEASVFMSQNFRCDKGIVDFVNCVFDRLFPMVGDSIGYTESDSLVFAKKYEGEIPPYRTPAICAVCAPSKKSGGEEDGQEDILDQPKLVAEKIRLLLENGKLNDGTPIKPKDIAILMRSARGKDKEYAAALREAGIPCSVADEKTFFSNPEVLLVLSLLQTIDNPRRDSQLAGLMCSPLFDFTPDEMVFIRKEGVGESLYDALCDYVAKHPDYERGAKLLKSLSGYRLIAEGSTVDTLIARLYRECGLLALASRNGGSEHLIKLYDYARRFEGSSFKGLYNFISYINKITDRKKNALDAKEAPLACDAVRIQTVHSSKGLEYPVVFLCDAQSLYRKPGSGKERLSYSEDFGIGMLLRTPSGLSRVNNPMKNVVVDYVMQRDFEEEMRVLYVALTRARERLYVVGKPRKSFDNLVAAAEFTKEFLSPYSVYRIGSSLEAILASVGRKPMLPGEFLKMDEPDVTAVRESVQGDVAAKGATDKADEKAEKDLYQTLSERFGFKYKNEYLTDLPEKMSVSKLYPAVLDGTDEPPIFDVTDENGLTAFGRERGILPAFKSGTDRRESAKRGIATHMFLQFCDFEKLAKYGAEKELSRLVEEKFLSERDAVRVRLDEIELFIGSELFRNMRGAKDIRRELRFNVRLPADSFTEEEERKVAYENEFVLVQGVIDCLYTDEDGRLHLVDYKTDRLTKEELENPSLAAEKLRASHRLQLSYYEEATRLMFGKSPETVEVYSLPLGDTVKII